MKKKTFDYKEAVNLDRRKRKALQKQLKISGKTFRRERKMAKRALRNKVV